LSRGPGRLQRAVLAQLEKAEGSALTLDELVASLEARGWRSDNVIRAARALSRVYAVAYDEQGPGRSGTRVALPKPAPPLSDDRVREILSALPPETAPATPTTTTLRRRTSKKSVPTP
jgi:hypothetical protein